MIYSPKKVSFLPTEFKEKIYFCIHQEYCKGDFFSSRTCLADVTEMLLHYIHGAEERKLRPLNVRRKIGVNKTALWERSVAGAVCYCLAQIEINK